VSAAELSRTDLAVSQADTNLWELRLDGKAPARRLTNWTGFNIISLSATHDGSRLSFLQSKYQDDAWVAALEGNGSRLRSPRRLTFDDRVDRPLSWTSDSKGVIFVSNRHGTIDTLVQEIDGEGAQVLASGPGPQTMSRATGNGRWVVFADLGASPTRIMHVARPGASPEMVAFVTDVAGLRCAFVASGPCLLELHDKDGSAIVRLLHPEPGLGRELFRPPARAGSTGREVVGVQERDSGKQRLHPGGVLIKACRLSRRWRCTSCTTTSAGCIRRSARRLRWKPGSPDTSGRWRRSSACWMLWRIKPRD
jgi:hypothetical protein